MRRVDGVVAAADDLTVEPARQPLFGYLARRGSVVNLDIFREPLSRLVTTFHPTFGRARPDW